MLYDKLNFFVLLLAKSLSTAISYPSFTLNPYAFSADLIDVFEQKEKKNYRKKFSKLLKTSGWSKIFLWSIFNNLFYSLLLPFFFCLYFLSNFSFLLQQNWSWKLCVAKINIFFFCFYMIKIIWQYNKNKTGKDV